MNQDEAKKTLDNMIFQVQKLRSNAREAVIRDCENVLEDANKEFVDKILMDLFPKMFGEHNVLELLLHIQEVVEKRGRIEGLDLYNAVYLLSRMMPMDVLELTGTPKQDTEWLIKGFPPAEEKPIVLIVNPKKDKEIRDYDRETEW